MPSQDPNAANGSSPHHPLSEALKILREAGRFLSRRDHLTASTEELAAIGNALIGRTVRCPSNHTEFRSDIDSYQQYFKSGELEFIVQAIPSGDSRTAGATIRITARRSGDPEHLRIALRGLRCTARSGTGIVHLPVERDSGTLYFHGLIPGENYTFCAL